MYAAASDGADVESKLVRAEGGSESTRLSGPNMQFLFDFEVFGRVQRVCMRKYTKKAAERFGLTGWCQNTEAGTVTGSFYGAGPSCTSMKAWLQQKGSPKARIDRAEFSEPQIVQTDPFNGTFEIRKVVFANGTCYAGKPRRKKAAVKSKAVRRTTGTRHREQKK